MLFHQVLDLTSIAVFDYALDITFNEIDTKSLARKLADSIPAGATSKGGVLLDQTGIDLVLSEGANAAVEMGWGESRDLEMIESNGILETNERNLGERAKKEEVNQWEHWVLEITF